MESSAISLYFKLVKAVDTEGKGSW
jgi:hypothetical protein